MAQFLRRPLFSAVGLTSTFERRCFSQIPARRDITRNLQPARPAQIADRSIRVASKEAMQIPSDVGILEGTFVYPSRTAPSLFKEPRDLLKLRWVSLKLSIRNYLSLLYIKASSPKHKRWYRRAYKIRRSQTGPTGVVLHQEMYNAFAAGDIKALRELCTDGIYTSFQARIAGRVRGEKVVWELVKYNKPTKVMSDRAAKLPIHGASIRQAVVRICSTQKLTRYSANGQQIKGTGKEKDIVEYLVLQKKYWDFKDHKWEVWGTTEETTLEEVERQQAEAANL